MLTDFVNELYPPRLHFEQEWWMVHVDVSFNRHGSGIGVILEGPNGIALAQSFHFNFKAMCNQAEYDALMARIRLAKEVDR